MRKIHVVSIITVLLAIAVIIPQFVFASGDTYYVALDGDNGNPGTKAAPFRTVQQAIAVAGPGDTIVVRPGTYGQSYAEGTYGFAEWNANRDDGRGGQSGTAEAPITLRAEHRATEAGAGQQTVLTGQGMGLYLINVSYIVLDGFKLTGFEDALGMDGASHIAVRHNVFESNTGVGIGCAPCSDSLFEHNAFLDPGPPYPDSGDAVQDYGLSFYQGSESNVIIHNYFFGKHNQALSFKRRAGPAYVAYNVFEGCMYTCLYVGQNDDEGGADMTSRDITVEYNTFTDAVDGKTGAYYRLRTAINLRNVNNAVVRYNYIENFLNEAVVTMGCESDYYCYTVAGRKPTGAQIYGNTIVNGGKRDPYTGQDGAGYAFNLYGRGFLNDAVEIYNNTVVNTDRVFDVEPTLRGAHETDRPPDITVKNNNFVDAGHVCCDLRTTTFDHNNWYGTTPYGSPYMTEDPMFVGPLAVHNPTMGPVLKFEPDWDYARAYWLAIGSPLVDAGVDVGLPYDGAAPDLGSNEMVPGDEMPPTPTGTPTALPTGTPTPTATSTPAPTDTSTPLPTETGTPQPTATVTPKPTMTGTSVPTATVTPQPTTQAWLRQQVRSRLVLPNGAEIISIGYRETATGVVLIVEYMVPVE